MFPNGYGQENIAFRKADCMNCSGKTTKNGIDQWVKDLMGEFIKCSNHKKK